MNTTLKRILGILAGAMVLCLVIVVLGLVLFNATTRSVISGVPVEAGEAANVAQAIADFTLPAGYTSAVAAQVADFELVGYDSADGRHHIYLFQLPPALTVDLAELERQLQATTEDPDHPKGLHMQVVDQQAVTIRGQAATLVISEGTNGQGQSIRSANAVFEGKNGQALLSFSGETTAWDAALIEAFISSME